MKKLVIGKNLENNCEKVKPEFIYTHDKLNVNPKDNCIVIRKIHKFTEYITEEHLLKAQQAILCNQKDALMDNDYILKFLEKYDRNL